MSAIMELLKDKNIISKTDSLKNKAFATLLDKDLSKDLDVIINGKLYYNDFIDGNMLIEVNNNELEAVDIVSKDGKYSIIDDKELGALGIVFQEGNGTLFTNGYTLKSIKNEYVYYDYMDIISRNNNIFDFTNSKKRKVKALGK